MAGGEAEAGGDPSPRGRVHAFGGEEGVKFSEHSRAGGGEAPFAELDQLGSTELVDTCCGNPDGDRTPQRADSAISRRAELSEGSRCVIAQRCVGAHAPADMRADREEHPAGGGRS